MGITWQEVNEKIAAGAYETPYPEEYRKVPRSQIPREVRDAANQGYLNFKADVIEAAGFTGDKRAEAFFRLAWEYGHSSGYHEVVNYALDLEDLR